MYSDLFGDGEYEALQKAVPFSELKEADVFKVFDLGPRSNRAAVNPDEFISYVLRKDAAFYIDKLPEPVDHGSNTRNFPWGDKGTTAREMQKEMNGLVSQ